MHQSSKVTVCKDTGDSSVIVGHQHTAKTLGSHFNDHIRDTSLGRNQRDFITGVVNLVDMFEQSTSQNASRMKDGKVTFRVLVDRPMYEVAGGGGACYKTSGRRDMGKPLGTISLTAEGGSLTVESFKAYEMNSAWKSK